MGLTLCSEHSGNEARPSLKTMDLPWWTVRDPVWGAPLWARALLVAAALGLLGLRFGDRDLVPYILDEPQFQDAAETHARASTWPSISPLTGNLGVPYGPAPVWFYTAVHRLVGPRPERSVLAVTLFLSLTELAFAAALARTLRGGAILFATLTALLAGSPFLFFWSRVAWEVPRRLHRPFLSSSGERPPARHRSRSAPWRPPGTRAYKPSDDGTAGARGPRRPRLGSRAPSLGRGRAPGFAGGPYPGQCPLPLGTPPHDTASASFRARASTPAFLACRRVWAWSYWSRRASSPPAGSTIFSMPRGRISAPGWGTSGPCLHWVPSSQSS